MKSKGLPIVLVRSAEGGVAMSPTLTEYMQEIQRLDTPELRKAYSEGVLGHSSLFEETPQWLKDERGKAKHEGN